MALAEWVVAGVVGVWLALAVHEAGHAAMAWLVRLPPRLIVIGIGPVLFVRRLREATLVVRALPLGGYVLGSPEAFLRRAALGLVLIAGPLANLTAMSVLGAAATLAPATKTPLDLLSSIELAVALSALLPVPARSKKPRQWSDGAQLLTLMFRRHRDGYLQVYELFRRKVVAGAGEPHVPSWAARRIGFELLRMQTSTETWACHDAVDRLRDLVEIGLLPRHEVLLIIEQVVSRELTFRDTGLSPAELDEWSAKAVTLWSHSSTLVTRGGVLAALGRPAEARQLLLPLVNEPLMPMDAFGCRAFLAQAAALDGDGAMAQHWMDAARATLPSTEARGNASMIAALEQRIVEAAAGHPP